MSSKKVWEAYNRLVGAFGSEYRVLLEAGQGEMARVVDPKIAEAVVRVRDGRVKIEPGFDGEYGKPLFEGVSRKHLSRQAAAGEQKSIMDF